MSTVRHIDHPLIKHSLTILRNKDTNTDIFRRHTAIVSKILIMEASRNLSLNEIPINTPLTETTGYEILESIVFVPVLRAGISMLFPARDFLPWAPVGFIGLERDEQTAIATEYYQKFPKNLADKQVIILDPMLATGGSLLDTITAVKGKGAKNVSCVCIVAAPEGIQLLQENYPDVVIYVAAIDEKLNSQKYIYPGLGDFGDRYFGTQL
ncbi:MAG: uracil phosphoribosyltransferase [Candidatus Marinimicrobia bacterium]|jgi:uracil phosphoribosyltransferase|nr:uracil phosphoribosyltransferase [Candidatus Neomarinimicrobiota bacterium]MBT3633992.1 uracil phosphoribosyltransferase [Candidatus Neomarinimicrobiota bacterium]MBT3683734.1 uracil phosphoribosyltransferase [Candidatus Neomarinimicrobiota bacterium]MBT3760614.1 uracil phosphoribosyltransferase [Candidatus Neomarinimicrobiota bacterium]MBT3895773.1 uracil phosphoribosyltransferase [Candidatus Neomarinimicrobiota bacterium]